MKNVKSKGNKINIIFSSFLVIGYIVCTYFFSSLASQVSGVWGSIIQALMLIIFGLLLFYATRVGEGKQVKRFSLAVLLLVVVPTLFIILAGLIEGFPLHDLIAPSSTSSLMGSISGLSAPSIIFSMACVAFGYGIPYTFFSGYEMKDEDEDDEEEEYDEDEELLEGGLEEELAEIEAEEDEEDAEEDTEEEKDDDEIIEITVDEEEAEKEAEETSEEEEK